MIIFTTLLSKMKKKEHKKSLSYKANSFYISEARRFVFAALSHMYDSKSSDRILRHLIVTWINKSLSLALFYTGESVRVKKIKILIGLIQELIEQAHRGQTTLKNIWMYPRGKSSFD